MEKGYLVMDKPQTTRNNNNSDKTSNKYNPFEAVSNKPALSLPISIQQPPPPYDNDYLTPVSSEPSKTHAQPPQLPALPARGFRLSPQSSVESRNDGQEYLPRADSGIEADFQRGPLSSVSSANPRSSTIYESIDAAGNVYTDPSHDTCTFRSRPREGETDPSGPSSLPPPPPTFPTAASDSEDGLDDNIRRRLHHPHVYNSLNQSNPQLYSETCLGGGDGSMNNKGAAGGQRKYLCSPRGPSAKHQRYMWCGLVILTLITLFLLAVLVYLFVLLIPGMQGHIRNQEDSIKRMGENYQNLSQKMDTLVWLSTANQTALQSPQALKAEGAVDPVATVRDLNASVREFDSRLRQMSDRLQLQINNISRVPDLSAVSGVANLSTCFYRTFSSIQAQPGPASTTHWVPAIHSAENRDNLLMSVTCGVEGGTQQFVEAKAVSAVQRQFRCKCDGQIKGHDRRTCHIHMILCPRLVPLRLTAVPRG
ncbi:hypothetical protein ACOMHN_047442 [Nucella lapillus]